MIIKRKRILGLFVLLVAMLLAGCGQKSTGTDESDNANAKDGKSEKDSAEVYELNVNSWTSSTHHWAYNVWDPWKELVEEKTDGRVTVNVYHGAALGKSTSVYQDIKGGLYEVSIAATQYFPDTPLFPYTIGNLPFAFEGSEKAAKVMKEIAEKYANEKITDVIPISPSATDPYDLFSTKPIKTVEDLKGLKMRASGPPEVELIKTLKAAPVTMSTEDIYEGLQKKQIDTAFYTPIGAVGMKYHEPAPYITKVNASVVILLPLMNKDFLENLPDDLQKIFDKELNPKLSELVINSYESELVKSYETFEEELEGRGEISTLSEEEMTKLRAAGKPAWDAWIEDANERGYPGQEMVDELISILKEEGYPVPY